MIIVEIIWISQIYFYLNNIQAIDYSPSSSLLYTKYLNLHFFFKQMAVLTSFKCFIFANEWLVVSYELNCWLEIDNFSFFYIKHETLNFFSKQKFYKFFLYFFYTSNTTWSNYYVKSHLYLFYLRKSLLKINLIF